MQDCADRSTLTETAVFGEVSQEVVALLSAAPAGWAGAPRSHAGCRIVHVVGGNCTAWRQNACKSQSGLNIYCPLQLLYCVLNALLSEWMLMDAALPLNLLGLIEFPYSWLDCVWAVQETDTENKETLNPFKYENPGVSVVESDLRREKVWLKWGSSYGKEDFSNSETKSWTFLYPFLSVSTYLLSPCRLGGSLCESLACSHDPNFQRAHSRIEIVPDETYRNITCEGHWSICSYSKSLLLLN